MTGARREPPRGGALIAIGAMVVFLSGLCTVGIGAWTLPASLFGNDVEDVYAIVLLLPTLVGGALFFAGGAFLFWEGHAALKGRRGSPEADAVARIGYWATIVVGALFGAVCLALTVRFAVATLRDGGGVGGLIVLALSTALAVFVAGWGLRRLRTLPPRRKEAP